MDNYIIELKLDDEIDSIELLFKQNNILITSFCTNFQYFNEIFVNKFDPKKKKIVLIYTIVMVVQ